jgi:hypothetical protein
VATDVGEEEVLGDVVVAADVELVVMCGGSDAVVAAGVAVAEVAC